MEGVLAGACQSGRVALSMHKLCSITALIIRAFSSLCPPARLRRQVNDSDHGGCRLLSRMCPLGGGWVCYCASHKRPGVFKQRGRDQRILDIRHRLTRTASERFTQPHPK